MKVYGEVKAYLHSLLISALDGGEWSVSRPRRFTLGTYWNMCGHQNGSGSYEDEKISCICQESNHNFSVVDTVA
jgi:hypothetical protein